jgi:hypothetical protein
MSESRTTRNGIHIDAERKKALRFYPGLFYFPTDTYLKYTLPTQKIERLRGFF